MEQDMFFGWSSGSERRVELEPTYTAWTEAGKLAIDWEICNFWSASAVAEGPCWWSQALQQKCELACRWSCRRGLGGGGCEAISPFALKRLTGCLPRSILPSHSVQTAAFCETLQQSLFQL